MTTSASSLPRLELVNETAAEQPSDLYASFTVANATRTVLKALDDHDITEADLQVLRSPADNAVIAIPKLGLVARVGVSRLHTERLARELEMAGWLNGRGLPATRPADMTPTPQLTVVNERVLTWWEYLPSPARGSLGELGGLLAQLHSQPQPWPSLPPLDPWARVKEQLTAATGVPADDLALLRLHWDTLRARWNDSRWPHEPGVVIHGDTYTGNTLRYNDITYLLDFEDSRIGPPQWDAASVACFLDLSWISDRQYTEFCEAYGSDVRDEAGSKLLVDIVLFRRTCWYASRTAREPGVVAAVRHRIATLLDPRLVKRWLPGA